MTPEPKDSDEEAAAARRANRRTLIGLGVVVAIFAGVPLVELLRHLLDV